MDWVANLFFRFFSHLMMACMNATEEFDMQLAHERPGHALDMFVPLSNRSAEGLVPRSGHTAVGRDGIQLEC